MSLAISTARRLSSERTRSPAKFWIEARGSIAEYFCTNLDVVASQTEKRRQDAGATGPEIHVSKRSHWVDCRGRHGRERGLRIMRQDRDRRCGDVNARSGFCRIRRVESRAGEECASD